MEPVLRQRGHNVVAPDLPCDDDTATLLDYADTVVEAIGERRHLIVVGQSYGGFTAPLVADRLPVDVVVFVAGMVPAPGEKPADWWENTGYRQAVEEQASPRWRPDRLRRPFVAFYHEVSTSLAEEAMRKERSESDEAYYSPWPLDALAAVPTRFVACTEDRFFPLAFVRRVVAERLGNRSGRDRLGPLRRLLATRTTCGTCLTATRGNPCRELCPLAPSPSAATESAYGSLCGRRSVAPEQRPLASMWAATGVTRPLGESAQDFRSGRVVPVGYMPVAGTWPEVPKQQPEPVDRQDLAARGFRRSGEGGVKSSGPGG